jgi:hypothetical protein
MARLSSLSVDALNDEQKAALAQLQSVLSLDGLGGPFSVWLRMPGIGPKLIDLFVTHRRHGKLEKRLFELMTQLVFDVTTEIMTTQHLSDATYARAKALLGEGVLIELIFAIGFYNMVGITLSSFDIPTPDGSKQLD